MNFPDRIFPSSPLLFLPLLFALIPISFSPIHPHNTHNQTLTLSLNYIVRFVDYKIAGDHRSYLERNLGWLSNWRWIERKNAAAEFPTDFGVVEIRDSSPAGVIAGIEKLEGVKDVHVDSRFSRSLFMDDRSEKDRSLFDEKKRPGKIFSSMSFEEGEGGYIPLINESVSWERKFLMEV